MREHLEATFADEQGRLLRERLSDLEPFPAGRFEGDGIVICAGGAAMFTNAYVLVHVLRRELGCQLPIEVWHLGPGEMSERMRFLLRELQVEPVDARDASPEKSLKVSDGWQLKALALMESRFSRVLLLDADQVPEHNPAAILSWPEFHETGAVLWPDICSLDEKNPIWTACGLPPQRMRAVESGQLLIDKSRHWDALQIALFLNDHARYYYRLVYGDKDLFLIAFLLAGNPTSTIPHLPFGGHPWCLFQRDFAGNRLFQHRTGAKWTYRGPQQAVDSFHHGEACHAALKSLREKWNGHIFLPPARSADARREEKRLAGIGQFQLATPGEKLQVIELLAFNEIGVGRTSTLSNWFCDEASDLELVFSDPFGEGLRLRKAIDGRWVEHGSSDAPILLFEGTLERPPVNAGSRVRSAWNAAGYILDN